MIKDKKAYSRDKDDKESYHLEMRLCLVFRVAGYFQGLHQEPGGHIDIRGPCYTVEEVGQEKDEKYHRERESGEREYGDLKKLDEKFHQPCLI
jgi:hypothetical protein